MNWFDPLPNAFFSTATYGPLPDKKILALGGVISWKLPLLLGTNRVVANLENSDSYDNLIPTKVLPEPGTPERSINFLRPDVWESLTICCALS